MEPAHQPVVFREVQAALRAGPPADGERPADESARVFFAYEWRRLEMVGNGDDRDLLTLLSVLAPEPVPLTLLSEAWGPLPAPLRQVAGHPERIGAVIDRLAGGPRCRPTPTFTRRGRSGTAPPRTSST